MLEDPQRDGAIAALDAGTATTSELTAQYFAGARIVKAFNAILERNIEKDARSAGPQTAARCLSLAMTPPPKQL